jgi:hypothetical protein
MKNIQLTFSVNILTGSVVLPEKKVLPYLRKLKTANKNHPKELKVVMRTIVNESVYVNRYKDRIKFTEFQDQPEIIEMTGFFEDGLRAGFDKTNTKIDMVDPSGGPYLNVGSSMDMFPPFKGTISGFVIEQGKVLIHVKDK